MDVVGVDCRLLAWRRSGFAVHGEQRLEPAALGADRAVWDEVRNLALTLVAGVAQIRSGRYRRPDRGLATPRAT